MTRRSPGAITISHLRASPRPIRSSYLVTNARFVACHQFEFVDKIDVLEYAAPGAVFLLNVAGDRDHVWERLPREMQEQIIEKKIRFFAIDALEVAKATGMGQRINTIMQTCYFAISGVLPREEAIYQIKKAIEKTYGKRGAEVVRRNFEAVDSTLAHLHEIPVPAAVSATRGRPPIVSAAAPDFVQKVTAVMLAGKGDLLPVSAFPGGWHLACRHGEMGEAEHRHRDTRSGTRRSASSATSARWSVRTRRSAPRCTIRRRWRALRRRSNRPHTRGSNSKARLLPFRSRRKIARAATCASMSVRPRTAPIPSTRRSTCIRRRRCGSRSGRTIPSSSICRRSSARELARIDHKSSQFLEPLFEYSGACAGCGETPYLKLLTQLFGDRLLIANATGCSSIYGGNLPTTPYTTNRDGADRPGRIRCSRTTRSSGFGLRLGVDAHTAGARAIVERLADRLGDNLAGELLNADQTGEAGIFEQRARVLALRQKLAGIDAPEARRLETLADYLVKKSVWLVGGDGWAYDIGYGGLDHVLASRRNVNILVLDTEVYSNTGGQQSKATPLGAVAKFAAAGKETGKKDLGLLANMYGHVYVARVALGAKMPQTVQAMLEAESYDGPSLIIAYSHCIAHGYDMAFGAAQQKMAVDSGVWPLYRFDPGGRPRASRRCISDYGPPRARVADYMRNESRFRMVERTDPARFKQFLKQATEDAQKRYSVYQQLAGITVPQAEAKDEDIEPAKAEK